MNKLIASGLYKSYQSGGHTSEVLSGVSITISEGQTIGVIGSSGSGKTTLLQILAGLEFPDQGSIYFNEINLLINNSENFNLMRISDNEKYPAYFYLYGKKYVLKIFKSE